MQRAERRKEARKIRDNIMKKGKYAPENCNLSRQERRTKAWNEALSIVRKKDSDYNEAN